MASNRVQAGIPTGGQFAATPRDISDIDLDEDEYTGPNRDPYLAIQGISASAVRENYEEGRGDEDGGPFLANVSDSDLNIEIAEHGRAIDRALERVQHQHEDDAWGELDGICGSVARHAIVRTESKDKLQAGLHDTPWGIQDAIDDNDGVRTFYANSVFEKVAIDVGNGAITIRDHGNLNPDPLVDGFYDPDTSDGLAEAAKLLADQGEPDEDTGDDLSDEAESQRLGWAAEDDADTQAAMSSGLSSLDAARATNVFGTLQGEPRRRLEALVENPTVETWDNSYSLIVGGKHMTTMWQAVGAVDRSFQPRVDAGRPSPRWDQAPSRETVLRALRWVADNEAATEGQD